jgi:hypothetical protein
MHSDFEDRIGRLALEQVSSVEIGDFEFVERIECNSYVLVIVSFNKKIETANDND